MKLVKSAGSVSAAELVALAAANPPQPLIEGLSMVGDVMLLHGYEESYKSVFILQMAEALATGAPFLDAFPVSKPRVVGVVETENDLRMLGQRLGKMFPAGQGPGVPQNLTFLDNESLKVFRNQSGVKGKTDYIAQWVKDHKIEILMIDTVNDFFRGGDDPKAETGVGEFFDQMRNIDVEGRIFVRHDRKEGKDDGNLKNTNELIRGSAEWKEDPELILYVKRPDKRTQELLFEVGKSRWGVKPPPMKLMFDAGTFRLTPYNPVIALLLEGEKSRQQLLAEGAARFGLKERTVDVYIKHAKNQFVEETQRGHQKVFRFQQERLTAADWHGLRFPDDEKALNAAFPQAA